jgi:hypothetical protein
MQEEAFYLQGALVILNFSAHGERLVPEVPQTASQLLSGTIAATPTISLREPEQEAWGFIHQLPSSFFSNVSTECDRTATIAGGLYFYQTIHCRKLVHVFLSQVSHHLPRKNTVMLKSRNITLSYHNLSRAKSMLKELTCRDCTPWCHR